MFCEFGGKKVRARGFYSTDGATLSKTLLGVGAKWVGHKNKPKQLRGKEKYRNPDAYPW